MNCINIAFSSRIIKKKPRPKSGEEPTGLSAVTHHRLVRHDARRDVASTCTGGGVGGDLEVLGRPVVPEEVRVRPGGPADHPSGGTTADQDARGTRADLLGHEDGATVGAVEVRPGRIGRIGADHETADGDCRDDEETKISLQIPAHALS